MSLQRTLSVATGGSSFFLSAADSRLLINSPLFVRRGLSSTTARQTIVSSSFIHPVSKRKLRGSIRLMRALL